MVARTLLARHGTQRSPAARRQRTLRALVVLIRPRQWVKNGLVVAAAGAAGTLGDAVVVERVALAFVAFCLLSGGVYAINDVRDAPEDRLHPFKRARPVAAGDLQPRSALTVALTLLTAGLVVCVLARPLLVLVGAGYVALTLSYTLLWRRVVILDLIAIAGGFVLRALAGGVAAVVPLSGWFVIVISACAIMLAAAKRGAERRQPTPHAGRRRVLHGYRPWLLRAILAGSFTVALLAYCVWVLGAPAATADDLPWRILTIMPFAACLVRYGVLVRRGQGEAPEDLLLADRPLQVAALTWLALFAMAVDAIR